MIRCVHPQTAFLPRGDARMLAMLCTTPTSSSTIGHRRFHSLNEEPRVGWPRATRRRGYLSGSHVSRRIGWVGTGVMGLSMAGHLLSAGHDLSVYNRTPSKAQPLVDKGATLASLPRDTATEADVVFSIVGYPRDVRHTVLGEDGLLAAMRPGSVFVDMTTSEPSLAQEIYHAGKERGIHCLDAPVSGGDVGAKEARLSIMVGGDEGVLKSVRPLMSLLGTNIRYMGGAGKGQHTKMVNQVLISTTMIGMVEGLLYGYRAGLDLDQVIAAVGSGAAGSWSINNLGPRIVKRNFDPGFFVEHFIKDMGIALSEAKRMNLSLPGLALAHQLYVAVQAQGHGQCGTHALMLALEKLNDVERT